MDNEPKKVFIKQAGEYVEITYHEFKKYFETENHNDLNTDDELYDRSYKNRFFIHIDDYLLEVTREQYVEFYKEKRRQKYIREESQRTGEFSVDTITTASFNGEEILVDADTDVSEVAIKEILIDKVRKCLASLPPDEYEIIIQIYYDNKTERQLAQEYRISQVAIHKRKIKILEKLKKLMNF